LFIFNYLNLGILSSYQFKFCTRVLSKRNTSRLTIFNSNFKFLKLVPLRLNYFKLVYFDKLSNYSIWLWSKYNDSIFYGIFSIITISLRFIFSSFKCLRFSRFSIFLILLYSTSNDTILGKCYNILGSRWVNPISLISSLLIWL